MSRARLWGVSVLAMASSIATACGGGDANAGTAMDPGETAPAAPSEELYGVLMEQCIEREGFDVTVRSDGGIEVQPAPDDSPADVIADAQARYAQVYERCLTETGFDRPSSVSPEDDYRQLVAVDDCIRGLGYPVESPTFEEFEAGTFPDNSGVLPQDSDELQRVISTCEG